MLSHKKKAKPLSAIALRQFLRKALDRGWYRERFHPKVERAFRNISDEDLVHGLELNTWIIEKTEPAKEEGLFRYTIRTADIEGVELHIVVLPFPGTQRFDIITKY